MSDKNVPVSISANVKLLGSMLGDCIADVEGQQVIEKIETIRQLAKSARSEGQEGYTKLAKYLMSLSNDELLPVARAFSHFLNLSNIVDQHHAISREMDDELSATQTLEDMFSKLMESGHSVDRIGDALMQLNMELVLTAHPTEITRRSLINKHAEIDQVLSQLELQGLTSREVTILHRRLAELIAQIWNTGDFREHRPTPVDEARWGFSVIENSLWHAVPAFMRRLHNTSMAITGEYLPLEFAPVSFTFWMGGDRDGNPNVTAKVTKQVLLLSRWTAIDLYLRDVQELIDELSMYRCTPELADLAEGAREPYRFLLRKLRALLREAKESIEAELQGRGDEQDNPLQSMEQLWEPLKACFDSLWESGMVNIAESKLLDVLRRVRAFGVHLVRFDIRQESDRHTEAISELTQYLGLGDYASWDEQKRQEFILSELQSKRPLIPSDWTPSDNVKEVLDTCRVISRHPRDAFGVYVISMARTASDVLLVKLLMRECGCKDLLPVAPLFETLEDLNNASSVMTSLMEMDWYKEECGNSQTVMIGYSDSAKDAGVMAAGWAQYRAQEELLRVCEDAGVALQLFHGRGGTIGRGGAPAKAALLSQPPGSLTNGLRVTEQGEMIRTKLGLTSIATKSLALYTTAILQANLDKPPVPKPEWREVMDKLTDLSCAAYRAVVRENPDFVAYFRQATPELELGNLPLGSRPARRKTGGGIESLRAIPWIFAWSQNRLMLPAWLGAGDALQQVMDSQGKTMLEQMCEDWPFFATRISMLEMVYVKADIDISNFYDSVLVDEDKLPLGNQLRTQLTKDISAVLSIRNEESPMEDTPLQRASIDFRNTYVDPLNLLQAELLHRNREKEDGDLQQAIMVTIAGISAGLRNTG